MGRPSNPPDAWVRLVDRRGPEECWPWTGGLDGRGYGRIRIARRRHLAHRLAYTAAQGPVPAALYVCHRCDNPLCCNPDHLFVGTHMDNLRDMLAKGRNRAPAGENHRDAKLSEAQVISILARLGNGERPLDLGAEFGVSAALISNIKAGRKWAHVQQPSPLELTDRRAG